MEKSGCCWAWKAKALDTRASPSRSCLVAFKAKPHLYPPFLAWLLPGEGGFGRLGEEERLPGGGGGGCLPGLLTSLSTGQEGPSSDWAPSGLSWVGACGEEASPPAQSSLCHHLQAPSCGSLSTSLSKVPNPASDPQKCPQANGRQGSGGRGPSGERPFSQGHSATRTGLWLGAWRPTLSIRS